MRLYHTNKCFVTGRQLPEFEFIFDEAAKLQIRDCSGEESVRTKSVSADGYLYEVCIIAQDIVNARRLDIY